MGKRNHIARLAQKILPKKQRKKIITYGQKAAASGKKTLNKGYHAVMFGNKGGKK